MYIHTDAISLLYVNIIIQLACSQKTAVLLKDQHIITHYTHRRNFFVGDTFLAAVLICTFVILLEIYYLNNTKRLSWLSHGEISSGNLSPSVRFQLFNVSPKFRCNAHGFWNVVSFHSSADCWWRAVKSYGRTLLTSQCRR